MKVKICFKNSYINKCINLAKYVKKNSNIEKNSLVKYTIQLHRIFKSASKVQTNKNVVINCNILTSACKQEVKLLVYFWSAVALPV